MTALLVVALVLPVVGGALAVVVPDSQLDRVTWTAVPTAAAWAVLVAASDLATLDPTSVGLATLDAEPIELGRLVVDPPVAAAMAGLALMVAASPVRRRAAVSAALSAITVFASVAALDDGGGPERSLAAGVAVLVVVVLHRLWTEGAPRVASLLAIAGGVVTVVGLASPDPERAAVAVVVGAGAVAVAIALGAGDAVLLLPAVLLAVARVVGVAGSRPLDASVDRELLAWVGVAVGVVGAAVVAWARPRSWAHRCALTGVLAAVVVLAQDVDDLRRAGVLLAAGATLAAVGRHPVALVALAPGIHAVTSAAGQATEPAQAGAAAALVLLAVAATADRSDRPVGQRERETDADGDRWGSALGTIVAVAFGVLPLWAWSGAQLDGYGEAVAVALGVTLLVGTGVHALRHRPDARGADPGSDTQVEAGAVETPTGPGRARVVPVRPRRREPLRPARR